MNSIGDMKVLTTLISITDFMRTMFLCLDAREESNNSAMDLPPTYDLLFGGKFITQDKFKLRREGFKTKKIVWKLTLFGWMASMKKSIFHKIH